MTSKLLTDLLRLLESPQTMTAILAALLILVLVFPGDDVRRDSSFESRVRRIRKEALDIQAADQMTAGYYEDLFQHSSRVLSTNRLVTGRWAANWSRWDVVGPRRNWRRNHQSRRLDSFLYYELRPHLNMPHFGSALITNSHGMADQEYSLERPAGVRRVVGRTGRVDSAQDPFAHAGRKPLQLVLRRKLFIEK